MTVQHLPLNVRLVHRILNPEWRPWTRDRLLHRPVGDPLPEWEPADFAKAFALVMEGCCPWPACQLEGRLGPSAAPANHPWSGADPWSGTHPWSVCLSCGMRWAAWFAEPPTQRAIAWGWPDNEGYQAWYEPLP